MTEEEFDKELKQAVQRIQQYISSKANELDESMIATLQANYRNGLIGAKDEGGNPFYTPNDAEILSIQYAQSLRDTKTEYLKTKITSSDIEQYAQEFILDIYKSGEVIVPLNNKEIREISAYFVSNLM